MQITGGLNARKNTIAGKRHETRRRFDCEVTRG